MVGILEGIGAVLGYLGALLFLAAFIVAVLIALNARGFRDWLFSTANQIPGFRSNTNWKAVVSSFVYIMIGSMILVGIGVTLYPQLGETESSDTPNDIPTETPEATQMPSPEPTETRSTEGSVESGTPTSTQSPTPSERPQTPPPSEVPGYTLVNVQDISYADVIRAETHVVTDQPVSQLSKEELRLISQDVVAKGITSADVNAIAIFFWDNEAEIGTEAADAGVDWAPYGEWDRAGDVETGNYEHHEFIVQFFNAST